MYASSLIPEGVPWHSQSQEAEAELLAREDEKAKLLVLLKHKERPGTRGPRDQGTKGGRGWDGPMTKVAKWRFIALFRWSQVASICHFQTLDKLPIFRDRY